MAPVVIHGAVHIIVMELAGLLVMGISGWGRTIILVFAILFCSYDSRYTGNWVKG